MAETAAAALNRAHRGLPLPEEIVVWEILVRLPARSLLRCRAVCRSFRRLTSTDDFLLAHHRNQPCLPLVSRLHGGQDLLAFDYRAFPAAASASVTASARLLPVAPLRHPGFQVRASCDGLLLISLRPASFYVCNPATRQWVILPFLPNFLGFYPHRASGGYRLLYGSDGRQNPNADDQSAVYYVKTVGSRNRRCIGRPVSPATSKEELATVDEALAKGVVKTEMYHPSVLLHGNLHFYPVERETNNTNMVMVFSTTEESFRWMGAPPPTAPNSSSLFEMNGKLALSSSSHGATVLDISVLQDYETETWELKYSIVLPLAWEGLSTQHSRFITMFLCEEGGVLVSNFKRLLHVDIEGKALANLHYRDQSLLTVPHRLKESLANHSFFSTKQNDGGLLLSPFII